jgi:hypothetical protein
MTEPASLRGVLKRKPVVAWALYDWANSAFATTIMAGFFPVFYSAISQDITTEQSQFWFNVTLAAASVLIAVSAPILGAVGDRGGARKKFLAFFAGIGILMTVALAWVHAGHWGMGLVLYALGAVGFSGANVFYDSMLVDIADPECLGPCDNYEGEELLSGVGGETAEQCKADCYFDFGNGAGNDDCHWSRSCDPLEPKLQCSYVPGLAESEGGTNKDCPLAQPALCEETCAPLTPNGCDCFGCCTFPELEGKGPGGDDVYVFLGSESDSEGTCTFATVGDPDLCRLCTPVDDCLNTCGRCEICLGKPTIPDDCFPGHRR